MIARGKSGEKRVTEVQVRQRAAAPALTELVLQSGIELTRFRKGKPSFEAQVLVDLAEGLRRASSSVVGGIEPALLRPFGLLASTSPGDFASASETRKYMAETAKRFDQFAKSPQADSALELIELCADLAEVLGDERDAGGGGSASSKRRPRDPRTAPSGVSS